MLGEVGRGQGGEPLALAGASEPKGSIFYLSEAARCRSLAAVSRVALAAQTYLTAAANYELLAASSRFSPDSARRYPALRTARPPAGRAPIRQPFLLADQDRSGPGPYWTANGWHLLRLINSSDAPSRKYIVLIKQSAFKNGHPSLEPDLAGFCLAANRHLAADLALTFIRIAERDGQMPPSPFMNDSLPAV